MLLKQSVVLCAAMITLSVAIPIKTGHSWGEGEKTMNAECYIPLTRSYAKGEIIVEVRLTNPTNDLKVSILLLLLL